MKTKSVTYEIVAKEIEALNLAGEKITVRNVLAHTGGSAGVVAEYIRRWQNQRRLVRSYNVSDSLLSAVMSEIEIAVNEALKVKGQELIELDLYNSELRAVNNELESKLLEHEAVKAELLASKERCALLEQDLHTVREASAGAIKELAAFGERLANIKGKMVELVEKVSQLELEKQKALEDAAAYKAKAEQSQEQLDKFVSQLKIEK